MWFDFHKKASKMTLQFESDSIIVRLRITNYLRMDGVGDEYVPVEEFNPKNFISVGVTERDVEMYKEVFDLFDVHKIGNLTPNDLRNALEMFGYHPKKHLIYQIISDIDRDESGGLDFGEFLKIMTDQTRPCDEDQQEDYERVFTYFDVDGTGKS